MSSPKFSVQVLPGFKVSLARRPQQDQEFILALCGLLEKFHINRNDAITVLKETARMIQAHTKSTMTETPSGIIIPGQGGFNA